MKRYIKSTSIIDNSLFANSPILPDTGTSLYNEYLNEKDLKYRRENKNRDGHIEMMSPEEYFEECSEYGFSRYVSIDQLKAQRREDESIDFLKSKLESGEKFYLPFINKADRSQEGLHRMMVLGELYGWEDKKYPVLIVTVYDQAVEDYRNLQAEAYDFLYHDFEDMCDYATIHVSEWDMPVPDNLVEQIKEKFNKATYGKDIDIDVEISYEDEPAVIIYLTRYKEYEFKMLTHPYTKDLAEMFDITK